MKQGDKLIFSSLGYFEDMTRGKVYTVLGTERRGDVRWPPDCFGSAMVKVENDNGGVSWWWAYRFNKVES